MKTFKQIAEELGNLVTEKNAAYGGAFLKAADYLKILYLEGLKPNQYVDALLLLRVFDKCCRVAQGHTSDSYEDIGGYGILGAWKSQKSEDIKRQPVGISASYNAPVPYGSIVYQDQLLSKEALNFLSPHEVLPDSPNEGDAYWDEVVGRIRVFRNGSWGYEPLVANIKNGDFY